MEAQSDPLAKGEAKATGSQQPFRGTTTDNERRSVTARGGAKRVGRPVAIPADRTARVRGPGTVVPPRRPGETAGRPVGFNRENARDRGSRSVMESRSWSHSPRARND